MLIRVITWPSCISADDGGMDVGNLALAPVEDASRKRRIEAAIRDVAVRAIEPGEDDTLLSAARRDVERYLHVSFDTGRPVDFRDTDTINNVMVIMEPIGFGAMAFGRRFMEANETLAARVLETIQELFNTGYNPKPRFRVEVVSLHIDANRASSKFQPPLGK